VGRDRLGLVVTVAAPKGESHQIVMLRKRNLRQAVETVPSTLEGSGSDVVVEVRIAVTEGGGLLGGKVAPLRLSKHYELPKRGLGGPICHMHKPSNNLKYYAALSDVRQAASANIG
jgi:hypothetical protein